MTSFRLSLLALVAALGSIALPADAACSVASEASNALVISTAPGCLSSPRFKAAVAQWIKRGMAQLQGQSGAAAAGRVAYAELEPSPQDRLRTLLYLSRIEAQMRNQARGGGMHYYGQQD